MPLKYMLIIIFLLPFIAFAGSFDARIITINHKNVWLSDLFSNIQKNHDVILGSAPDPGHQYVVGPQQLKSIEQQYDLPMPALAQRRELIIKRLGFLVSKKSVSDALKQVLHASGIPLHSIIKFSDFFPPLVSTSEAPKISVKKFNYDHFSLSFSALISIKSPKSKEIIFNIAGSIEIPQEIVIASHFLHRGETIKRSDLSVVWETKRIKNIGVLHNVNQAINKMIAFEIPKDTPVFSKSLREPAAIEKGAIISLLFDVPGVNMRINGIALSEGKIGSEIKVINPISHDIIIALVTAPNQAEVKISSNPVLHVDSNISNDNNYYSRRHST